MKTNYFSKVGLFLFCLFSFSQLAAQNQEQRAQITKNYDLQKLNQLSQDLLIQARTQKQEAIRQANINGWPITIQNEDGSFSELQRLSADGKPIYYSTHNTDAAASTRTDHLHNGGSLGLNLEGQGMVARVWDGGPSRPTHQEYGGRITIGDGNTTLDGNSFHACHVTGTIAASGVQANAKGMAPQATVRTFDWNSDESEAAAEAANGMLLSNHSYGVPIANAPGPWLMGAYSQEAYNWDLIAYNAPYYLMVASAGNDGNNTNTNPSTAGYDKLNGNKNAKNNLVVANAQDANVNGSGGLISVAINGGSSEGPSDDGRIKPDITGNGTGLYSSFDSSDTAYNTISGTSMAAPNVTGSLLLLQQHYNNVNGTFMKAATLKGLATHTADDAGNPGPDAVFGWGLMNAKAAAEAISNDGFQSLIQEESLAQGATYTLTVNSDGSGPLIASITWTDVPGTNINTGTLNDTTPALVNDLDIRVTDASNTYYPWRLQSNAASNALRNGDNAVDNVERIEIDAPAAGNYTITVTHKGTLTNGPQDFSLVVTGLDSDFAMNASNTEQTVCSTSDVTFNFNYTQVGAGTTNLSAVNAPAGATVNFDKTSVTNADSSFSVTVGNLSALTVGEYEFDVVANDGTETETRRVRFNVYHPTIANSVMTSPTNGDANGSTSMSFTWDADANAQSYDVQISIDPSFAITFYSGNVTTNSLSLSGFASETVYYWRVRANNICGSGAYGEPFNFQVGSEDCSNTYSSSAPIIINNTQDNSGAGYGNGWSRSPINVPDDLNITDVTAEVNVSHTYVGDLRLYIESPVTFNTLVNEQCGTNENITATFTDAGSALSCGTNPAITGNVAPSSPFSIFAGTNSVGEWSFTTRDAYNGDNGTINSWTLTICGITAITNLPSFTNNGLVVNAGSTYTVTSTDMEVTTPSEAATQQVYRVTKASSVGNLQLNNVTLNVGDTFTQDDVNNGLVTYVNSESGNASDDLRVDILNNANGWLANQTINITINEVLGLGDSVLENVGVWPNPTDGSELNIRFKAFGNEEANVTLYDLQGRRVYQTSMETTSGVYTNTLSIGRLTKGVYLLNIEQDGKKATKKIVIE